MLRQVTSQAPPATRQRHSLLFCTTMVACAGLFVALALPLLAGKVYVFDDLGEYHLPARAFYARCLDSGERFDWWPQLYGGFYLTGEGQAGTYHPLHLVLYGLLPLNVAFDLEVLLIYPWMLCGGYFWLKRLLGQSDAALFGSLVFTFSGFNLLHFMHPNAIAVVSHIPWLLLAIDVLMHRTSRLKAAIAGVGISLLTASQLLLGYPQYVWFSLLAEMGYVLFMFSAGHSRQNTTETTSAGGLMARISVAKVAGVLLGGVQLLPTVDALGSSVRQVADSSFSNLGSLHPLNLIQLVGPYLFEKRVVGQNTHELGLYVGAVPLVLAFWLLLRRGELGRFALPAKAAGLLATFSLVMAAGSHGFVYHMQTYLPVVGKFRFPCRMIILFHLAMALLAAIAIAVLVVRQYRVVALGATGGLSASADFTAGQASSGTLQNNVDGPLVQRRGGGNSRSRSGLYGVWGVPILAATMAMLAPMLWPRHTAGWPLVWIGPVLLAAATALWMRARAQEQFTHRLDVMKQGVAYWQQEDWASAEDRFREVLDGDPHDYPALVSLASMYKDQYYAHGDKMLLDQANELLERAVKVEPDRHEAWNVKGVLYQAWDRPANAIAAYKKVLDIDASYYAVWVNLGMLYATVGDLVQAEACSRKGTELVGEAQDVMPWRVLAAIQLHTGNPDAFETLNKARQIDNTDVPTLVLLAGYYLGQDGPENVRQALRLAVTADTLIESGEPDTLNGAVKSETVPRAKRTLALVRLRNQEWRSAAEAAQQAIAAGDQPAVTRLILAVATGHLGDATAAREHLDAAEAAWPEELRRAAFRATQDGHSLWFDTAEELERLRDEASHVIQGTRG